MKNYKINRRTFGKSLACLLFSKEIFDNPNTANSDFQELPIELTKDYGCRIIKENEPNPSEIKINLFNRSINYVTRLPNGLEEIKVWTDKGIFILPQRIKMNRTIYKTPIALNASGELFVYQSDGVEENLRIYSSNLTLQAETHILYKNKGGTKRIQDIAINPIDNRLYILPKNESRIDVLDTKTMSLENWSDCDWKAEFLCFDKKGNMYLTYNNPPSSFDPILITKISVEKKKEEIVLKKPFENYRDFRLNLTDFDFDEKTKRIILSGEMEDKNFEPYGSFLFSVNIKTKELEQIARIKSENKKILGISSCLGDLYFTTASSMIKPSKDGKIVYLTKNRT